MLVRVNEYIYTSVTDTDDLWKVLKACELHANGNVPLTHLETDGAVVQFVDPDEPAENKPTEIIW